MSSSKTNDKSPTAKKPSKIKQACDCCHARKIRCDGAAPCNNCQTTSLPCTYLLIPKKKGPKGPSARTPRAVLKMRMRQEQEQQHNEVTTATTGKIDTLSNSTNSPPLQSPSLENGMSYLSFSHHFEPSPLLTLEVAQKYANTFFKHKYAITPILPKRTFMANLDNFHTSPDTYGLVASMSAAMASLQPQDSVVSSPSEVSLLDPTLSVDFFIRETKRSRRFRDIERPLLSDAQSNFFLFAALFNLDRHNSAWFHLREAMTMLQMLRLHEEDSYLAMDAEEALYSRRTFWLLFVTERAYALQRHRPLTLQRSISLPAVLPSDPESEIISGFLDLVSLFQNFDDNFVRIWNISSQTPNLPFAVDEKQVSVEQLEALQNTLASSLRDISKRTETQQVDLLISRQWLKTMVWQLCVAKGLLSNSNTNHAMSFHYPVTIARDVAAVSTYLRKESFEAHGVGILEKIFDIGCSLSDVLQLQQTAPRPSVVSMEVGPREYLLEMLRLLSTVFGGSSRYLPLLASKADQCLQVGPRNLTLGGTTTPKVEEQNGGEADVNDHFLGGGEMSSQHFNHDGVWAGTEVFGYDFDSLSEASTAWLGSMPDEYIDIEIPFEGGHGSVFSGV